MHHVFAKLAYLAERLVSSIVTPVDPIVTSVDQPVLLCCGHYHTAKMLFSSGTVDGRVKEESVLLLEDGCLLTQSTLLVGSESRRVPNTTKVGHKVLISLLSESHPLHARSLVGDKISGWGIPYTKDIISGG